MGKIAVFGAGGRAGRAITDEARQRGHRVTAVVRDPASRGELETTGVTLAKGDVTDAAGIAAISRGHDAVVNAVSPVPGPDELAALGDRLDGQIYVKAVDALLEGMAASGAHRLVAVGLFVNLLDQQGRLLLEDPAILPAQFKPFALAHTAGLDRLRAAETSIDWLVLTPPALLDVDGPRTGRYRTSGDRLPPGMDVAASHLSYADLGVAAIDEIERPRHHQTRIAVFD